jgi:hypothetical protein
MFMSLAILASVNIIPLEQKSLLAEEENFQEEVTAEGEEPLYCRGKACRTETRWRANKRLKFRWDPNAVPPIHGGDPSTVNELLEKYGTIPHRQIRRIRRTIVKEQTSERDMRLFELRALQPQTAVPDTLKSGRQNCRSQNVCVDPVRQRRERRENERRMRGGKAGERASFFSGSIDRRMDAIQRRFGLQYTEHRREMKPIAERGLPVPRKKDLRTY